MRPTDATHAGRSRGSGPRLALPLASARLRLREFEAGDEAAVLEARCDPRVTRHLPYGPRDETGARRHLREVIRQQAEPRRAAWELAVARSGDGRVIGACDLSLTSRREAEIGYLLARAYWGCGFGTELATRLVQAAFEDLGVERVTSTVAVGNEGSVRVLEKAGLRWEATSRHHARVQARWWDVHLFSLGREAWVLERRR